jgi:aspartyl-tRNA(Asn)/glutamyl-tRNA(Gln) amidotransferase subunit C
MSISLEEVRHVAKLARLELDTQELLMFQSELNALLGYIEDIRTVKASFESHFRLLSLENIWEDDFPEEGLSRESALQNAPLSRAGLFVVPNILEG